MEDKKIRVSDEVLEKLQKDISEIKVALLGNEYNPEGGLLYKTKRNEDCLTVLENRIRSLEDKIKKTQWTAAGGAAVVTAIVTILFNIRDIISLFNV